VIVEKIIFFTEKNVVEVKNENVFFFQSQKFMAEKYYF